MPESSRVPSLQGRHARHSGDIIPPLAFCSPRVVQDPGEVMKVQRDMWCDMQHRAGYMQEAYRAAESRMVQEAMRRHVLRVLRIWRSWFLFSDDYLNGLQVWAAPHVSTSTQHSWAADWMGGT